MKSQRMRPREVFNRQIQDLNTRRTQYTDKNLTYFDDFRNSSASVEMRKGSAVQRVNESFRMAHILSMLPSALADYNSFGLSIEIGGFLALQHFNARSGAVIPDLPERLQNCNLYLTMDLLDTGASAKTAVLELMTKIPASPSLASPRPLSILGAGNSIASESLSIISAVNNVAQTSCCSTSQELNEKSQHPFFSRTIPTNLANARAAALYFQSIGVMHVATLHVEDVYGADFSRLFGGEAKRLGIDVFSVSYVFNCDQSLQTAVTQIKKSQRKFVFGMFYPKDLVRVADFASEARIMGENGYVWILGEGNDGQLRLNTTAEKRPRLLNATNGMGWIEFKIKSSDRYNAALNSFKQDSELQKYYFSRRVAPQQDSAAKFIFTSLLYAPDFALLNYDALMAIGIAACETNKDFFSASDLFETMSRLEFSGVTDHVEFKNGTGTRFQGDVHFTIQNLLSRPHLSDDRFILLESIESVVIDLSLFDETAVEIVAPFVYADNTTNQPPALPPPDEELHLISNWALGIGLGFCVIMMVMSTAWGVWTCVNRKQRTVRASQPFFLIMLCIGTFLMASSVIPTSFQEPMNHVMLDAGCMLFPWLVAMGFVTAFSALFTKNGRINALYQNARACRRVTIKPKDVIKPFLILLALNATILVLWTTMAPFKWHRKPGVGEDKFGRPAESFGICASDNSALSKTFGSLLAVVNVVPVSLSIYQSYRCRDLPTEFNESRYLAISMASLLETFLIGLPFFLITVLPSAAFLCRAVLLCVSCLAILLPMFIPKWLNIDGPSPPTRRISMKSTSIDATFPNSGFHS